MSGFVTAVGLPAAASPLRMDIMTSDFVRACGLAELQAKGRLVVVPMDAVLDAAAIERKAHMWAAVVEREDASLVIDHQDRGMAAMRSRRAA